MLVLWALGGGQNDLMNLMPSSVFVIPIFPDCCGSGGEGVALCCLFIDLTARVFGGEGVIGEESGP